MSQHIISIDVGTTNIKMTLFDSYYHFVDSLKFAHQQVQMTDIVFELGFEEIWENILFGLKKWQTQYKLKEVELVITTAMHSIQLLDAQMQLVGSVITWADNRGAHIIDQQRKSDWSDLYYRTGTPIHPMNPFFKLLVLFKQDKNRGLRVGSLKDLIFYRLTGEWSIDVSNASSSGLFSLEEMTWDTDALQQIGISVDQLPIIQPMNYQQMAKIDLFSNVGMTVALGTSDGVSSNFVFNDLQNDSQRVAVLSVGTSHAIRIIHDKIELDYHIHNFCYVIKQDKYLVGIPSNNGANVLSWANEVFNASFDELNDIMEKRPETRAIFIPYLNGERSPIWNDRATASFSNLSRNDQRAHVLFALILGMIFNIKENADALSELVNFDAIGLVGGVTQIPAFPQLLSDILGIKIFIPKMSNAETMGSIRATKDIDLSNKYQIVTPNISAYNRLHELYLAYLQSKK